MLTYQDFLEVGQSEKARMDFIIKAINEYKSSDLYNTAVEATMYYNGENPTINRYEKVVYDVMGKPHVDMWTANHKIASSFFGFAVDQENSYLLGNGVMFKQKDTKRKLGTQTITFDQQIMLANKNAIIDGVSYIFWNFDHIEVFSAKEFIALIDEESGAIMAGIRFWQIDNDKPLRVTLFEIDGYTDYIKRRGEDMQIFADKRPYVLHVTGSRIDRMRGDVIYQYENYPGFPVVPLIYNENMKSLLCGKRNTLDALDLVSSNMVNNVDEGNLIYWVLTNYGGMDDLDDQRFLERLKTTHIVHTEGEGTAEPHTINAPFEGTQGASDMLLKRLYMDFQCFDSSAVSAGNQTATAIKASYIPLDLKVDKDEMHITKAINGILALAGIEDEPSYTRNKLINEQEEMQTLLSAAQYLDDEYITTKVLTILGDPDMAGEILDRQRAQEASRFQLSQGSVNEPDQEPNNMQ